MPTFGDATQHSNAIDSLLSSYRYLAGMAAHPTWREIAITVISQRVKLLSSTETGSTLGPMNEPSSTLLEKQVSWLVDRAAISDLLIDFARCLDEDDYEAYAANFTEDAILELPFRTHHGRAGLAESVRGDLGVFARTHHLSANHAITIDENTATSRSYVQAAHVKDVADDSDVAMLGGWYQCEYRRTPDGWRFTRVQLSRVWTAGMAQEIGLEE